jgi:hypothetical protein
VKSRRATSSVGSPSSSSSPSSRGLKIKLSLLGLLLYLLFLTLQLPLAWLIKFVPANYPMQFHQVSGHPWQGNIERITWKIENEHIELGSLAWQWLPSELLNGRLGIQFKLTRVAQQLNGYFLLSRKGYNLKSVQGELDAALLGFASRPLSLLQPKGSITIDIPDLHLSPKRIHGEATIHWLNARSGLVAAPMGDYRANLSSAPDGRRALINIQTLQGALNIAGNIDYSFTQGLDGRLLLTPPSDERSKVYLPALSLLGRPNASGAWTLLLSAPR